MHNSSEITLRATAPSLVGLLALDAAAVGMADEGCIDIKGSMDSESFREAVQEETQKHKGVSGFIGCTSRSNS